MHVNPHSLTSELTRIHGVFETIHFTEMPTLPAYGFKPAWRIGWFGGRRAVERQIYHMLPSATLMACRGGVVPKSTAK